VSGGLLSGWGGLLSTGIFTAVASGGVGGGWGKGGGGAGPNGVPIGLL
jgi:hypothetical protein